MIYYSRIIVWPIALLICEFRRSGVCNPSVDVGETEGKKKRVKRIEMQEDRRGKRA